jgi:excisionase family DNA binding protein
MTMYVRSEIDELNPSPPPLPVTMSIKEAAAYLGLSLSATYEAAARGEIPTMKIGRRVLVKREQLALMVH